MFQDGNIRMYQDGNRRMDKTSIEDEADHQLNRENSSFMIFKMKYLSKKDMVFNFLYLNRLFNLFSTNYFSYNPIIYTKIFFHYSQLKLSPLLQFMSIYSNLSKVGLREKSMASSMSCLQWRVGLLSKKMVLALASLMLRRETRSLSSSCSLWQLLNLWMIFQTLSIESDIIYFLLFYISLVNLNTMKFISFLSFFSSFLTSRSKLLLCFCCLQSCQEKFYLDQYYSTSFGVRLYMWDCLMLLILCSLDLISSSGSLMLAMGISRPFPIFLKSQRSTLSLLLLTIFIISSTSSFECAWPMHFRKKDISS